MLHNIVLVCKNNPYIFFKEKTLHPSYIYISDLREITKNEGLLLSMRAEHQGREHTSP